MRRIMVAVCLTTVCVIMQAQTATRGAAARNVIRVGLWTLWHDKEVSVMPVSAASVRICERCAARPLRTLVVRAKDDRLIWIEENGQRGTSRGAASELQLTGSYRLAAHGESLALEYPLRISAKSGVLTLAATLPVERYVELVVAAESSAEEGFESRKALAVVARSFALHSSHGHKGFDVCDSTHCQWVRWHSTAAAHEATLATAGENLWYQGSRAEAYFHQNCGGRTAAASEVWSGHGVRKYLVSRPDSYCQREGSSEWSATISRAELTQALAAARLAATGLSTPGWQSLRVVKRGESGRVTMVQVGSTAIPAEDFRLAVGRALGWNRIRSNWFEIAAEDDGFHFHGRGSGHGVGLCQAGAAEMAREGHGYREILAQYFPDTRLAEETTGAAWLTLSGQGLTVETSEATDAAYMPELARALAEAESRSGLKARAGFSVRTYRSTSAFRDATLAPGWVAAFTEGDRISVQPLRVLDSRKLLEGTLRHEFLHALVEEQANEHTPLWLREGLVELWSGDLQPRRPRPALSPESIDAKLTHAVSEAESEAAHRAAGWYAGQLLERFGRAQVMEWLRSGVPASALTVLR
jgi:stage II sporulation protein D